MIDERTRINAIISYCFLGWLFLLARRNPIYQSPFIRAHAWAATRIHLAFFATCMVFIWVIEPHIVYVLPVVDLPIGRIIFVGICFFFMYLIIRGALVAHHGREAGSVDHTLDLSSFSDMDEHGISAGTLDPQAREQANIISILSFVPLVGFIVARHHPGILTGTGERVGGLFAIILVALSVWSPLGSVMMILVLLYIVFFSFVAVNIVLHRSVQLPHVLARIPSIDSLYRSVRAGIRYAGHVSTAIIGRRETLDWSREKELVRERDCRSEELFATYYTDATLPISPYLIPIPLLNIIFLPRIFFVRQGMYVRAIMQGIATTLILIILWGVYGMTTPYQVWLLFPVALGLGTVRVRPFYRIPVVYECSLPLSFLFFGWVDRRRRLAEKAKENSVSYKIE